MFEPEGEEPPDATEIGREVVQPNPAGHRTTRIQEPQRFCVTRHRWLRICFDVFALAAMVLRSWRSLCVHGELPFFSQHDVPMGIRFACHQCGKRLNIKRELAGKRGVCPQCEARFRIPAADTEVAQPISAATVDHAHPSNGQAESRAPASSYPPNHSAGATTVTPSALAMDSLALMDEDSTATWYVRPPAGGQYGPADTATLRQWMDQGRIASNSLLWRDGWAQWRTAMEALPDFESRMASPAEANANANDVVATGNDAPSTTTRTSSKTHVSTNPQPGVRPGLSGHADLGADKSKVQNRRVQVISLLAALVVGLVGILIYLVMR